MSFAPHRLPLRPWVGQGGQAREIDARGEPTYIPTPALFELWEGVARSQRPREEARKVSDFVAEHDLLPFGEPDAREAGLLSGRLY